MTGNARILVVDDQPTIVDLLSTVLTGHGFAVDTAASGTHCAAGCPDGRPRRARPP